MDDAAKAAKRAEIEAKVAAMKAEQKRLEVRPGDDATLPPNDPRASRSSPEPPRPLNLTNALPVVRNALVRYAIAGRF